MNAVFDGALRNSECRCHTNQSVVLVIADDVIFHGSVDEVVYEPPMRLGDVRVGEPTFMSELGEDASLLDIEM